MCLQALGFREAGSSRLQGFVWIQSRVPEPPELQGLSVEPRLQGRAGHFPAAAAHCPADQTTHTHTHMCARVHTHTHTHA